MTMGQDLATRKGSYSREQIIAGLALTAKESKAQLYEYLQFSGKEGLWKISKSGDPLNPEILPAGTKFLLNIHESRKGYVCWKDGQVADQDLDSLFVPVKPESELPDHGPYSDPERDGWRQQFSLVLKEVGGKGRQFIFKTNSASGVRAVGNLIDKVAEQIGLYDPMADYPVVEVGAEAFKSKGYVNRKPTFSILKWEHYEAPLAITAAAETDVEAGGSEGTEVKAKSSFIPMRRG